MDADLTVEISCPMPVAEVRERLAAGLVPAWRLALPPGSIIGSVGDSSVRAHLPGGGRRFPAVLDARLATAGRGCLLRGQIRRNPAATALVVALVLLEFTLIVVSVAAAASGTGLLALAAPAVFLVVGWPLANRVRSISAEDVTGLRAWLQQRLAIEPA